MLVKFIFMFINFVVMSLQTNSNARLMRFKSWPFYHDWNEIFGRDRATGEQAEDLVAAVNELISKETQPDVDLVNGIDGFFEGYGEENEIMSVCQPSQPSNHSGNTKSSKGKKRKLVMQSTQSWNCLGPTAKIPTNAYATLLDALVTSSMCQMLVRRCMQHLVRSPV